MDLTHTIQQLAGMSRPTKVVDIEQLLKLTGLNIYDFSDQLKELENIGQIELKYANDKLKSINLNTSFPI